MCVNDLRSVIRQNVQKVSNESWRFLNGIFVFFWYVEVVSFLVLLDRTNRSNKSVFIIAELTLTCRSGTVILLYLYCVTARELCSVWCYTAGKASCEWARHTKLGRLVVHNP